LADRAIRPDRLGLVATPLIGDRRIETEGADTPPRIETHSPPALVIRCVTGWSTATGRAGAVHRATDRANVGRVAPRGAGRQTVSIEVRDHRLEVEALERRELRALDQRPVLAAVGAGRRGGPVAARELILHVHPRQVVLDVRRERRVEVQAREVTV